MAELKVGDQVQLLSGSPTMTCSSIDHNEDECECKWFVQQHLQTGKFSIKSLKIATAA